MKYNIIIMASKTKIHSTLPVANNLLLVEDEAILAKLTANILTNNGYSVTIANDGEEAMEIMNSTSFDVYVLDVMLPKISGLELCKQIREDHPGACIIMLTAQKKIDDKISGLDSGADDYLTKPFEAEELLARIRSIMRRRGGSKPDKQNILTIADLSINLNNMYVTRDDIPVELTTKEVELLLLLAKNSPKPISRDMIMQTIWPNLDDTNIIDVYIRHLRQKIDKPYSNNLIHTVSGIGYKLADMQNKGV